MGSILQRRLQMPCPNTGNTAAGRDTPFRHFTASVSRPAGDYYGNPCMLCGLLRISSLPRAEFSGIEGSDWKFGSSRQSVPVPDLRNPGSSPPLSMDFIGPESFPGSAQDATCRLACTTVGGGPLRFNSDRFVLHSALNGLGEHEGRRGA